METTTSGESTMTDSTVLFTDEDINRWSAKPALRDGVYYRVRVIKATAEVWKKSGSLRLRITCAPVDATGKNRSPVGEYNLTLPFLNRNHEGHKAPNTMSFTHKLLRAIDATRYPAFPRWNKEQKCLLSAVGEVLTEEQDAVERARITRAVAQGAGELYGAPATLIGTEFYAQYKDNGQFAGFDSALPLTEEPAGVEYANFTSVA